MRNELLVSNREADLAEKALIEAGRSGTEVMTAEDFPVENFFAPGLYARMVSRKAGTFIVGHAHKHAHLSLLVAGRLRVLIKGSVREIVAPSRPFLTEAGIRKCTFAVEDSTLITFHPTNETDLEKLEDELITKSECFKDFENAEALDRLKVANCQEIGQENLATT